MAIALLLRRWLALLFLLLCQAGPSTAAAGAAGLFLTTVFSRDWLPGRPQSAAAGSTLGGSPWCDAGCGSPNSSRAVAAHAFESAAARWVKAGPKPTDPPYYRVPALVQIGPGGSLLAVSGERNGTGCRLVGRLSTSRGQTWSWPPVFIAGTNSSAEPPPVADMPAMVYDAVHRRVVLIYQQWGPKGSPPVACELGLRTSSDGQTWSPAMCLDAAVPEKLRRALSPGPGAGLQLPTGRLLFSVHSTFKSALVLWSDSGGATWTASTMPGEGAASTHLPGSECQLAIAHNGSVLLNCRPYPEQTAATDGRLTAVSEDSGRSFEFPNLNKALWGADCASGLAALPASAGGGLYFSKPRNNNSACPWCRTHMAVIRSTSDGRTWESDKVLSVWPGESGYSVLAALSWPGGRHELGLLYERGDNADHYRNITFAVVPPSLLKTDDIRTSGGGPKEWTIDDIVDGDGGRDDAQLDRTRQQWAGNTQLPPVVAPLKVLFLDHSDLAAPLQRVSVVFDLFV